MHKSGKKKPTSSHSLLSVACDILFNTLIGLLSVLILYTIYTQYLKRFFVSNADNQTPQPSIPMSSPQKPTASQSNGLGLLSSLQGFASGNSEAVPDCNDPLWCSIPMPETSSYKFFQPPSDERRWKIAQSQAASGDLVILREISKVFPHPFDFLDGDRSFRRLHQLIDIFIDEKSGIEALLPSYFENPENKNVMTYRPPKRRLQEGDSPDETKLESKVNENGLFPWEVQKRRVIPVPYNFRASLRSPIVQLGYAAFKRDFNEYFSGNRDGGTYISRNSFLDKWNGIKNEIDVPFITVCLLNENWGMLSTMVPNRTAKWGNCCEKPRDRGIYEFLNHPKTLMLAVNQHSNISHPKVITLPRGLPLTWEKTAWIVWDLIRSSVDTIKKGKLLFASSSSWGPRPQILRCVSSKISVEDFEGHDQTPASEMKKTKLNRKRYYEKLASARFGLSLPGLGYDTFRMWELLTMGSIVVVERGIGFDRTLWKLPALLVEDFAEITPDMLRVAYVEALYHVKEFEFERLTQSFWWTLFANVSKAMNIQPLLDKFPMEAELPNFARPLIPYDCGKTRTCPPGIKNTPKISC